MNRETNDSKRTYFTFYESFFTAIDQVDISEQLPIYKAIAEYALYRKEPDLMGMGAAMWALIRPNLESNWKRWENGVKGGAPKGSANNPSGRRGVNITENQSRTNQELTENKPKTNQCLSMEIGDKEIGDIEIRENNKRTAKRFTPPSLDEVSEYITQKGYTISAQAFINFYESNGWRVGKNPMKSWKAAVSSWNSREGGNTPPLLQTLHRVQMYEEL